MKQLVVVADDFGLCPSVNDGIIAAYEQGIVTELSLMLGSPGTDDGVQKARRKHIQNIGIHVLLKHWREHGDIFRRAEYLEFFKQPSATLQALLEAELHLFKQTVSRAPTHITSQYGILSDPHLLPAAVGYAKQHHIPMRLPMQTLYQQEPNTKPADILLLKRQHIITTDYFFGSIGGDYDTVKTSLLAQLSQVRDGQSAELMLHPGHNSAELRSLSSMVVERERDLRLAVDAGFRQAIEAMNFSIVPYAAIVPQR